MEYFNRVQILGGFMSASKRTRTTVAIAAAFAASWNCHFALAVTDNWTGGSDNWSNPADWSAGVPVTSDVVNFTDSDGVSRTVTYDYTGSTAEIELTIDLTSGTGGAANTLSMS